MDTNKDFNDGPKDTALCVTCGHSYADHNTWRFGALGCDIDGCTCTNFEEE